MWACAIPPYGQSQVRPARPDLRHRSQDGTHRRLRRSRWYLPARVARRSRGAMSAGPIAKNSRLPMPGHDIHIIGGGLAGSEAAWQLAQAGHKVRLSEMRGSGSMTPAHQSDRLAELVCSNSFRSDDAERNAVGLLRQEMRDLGSLILTQGDIHKVPAGSALAVDRDGFADGVTAALEAHPNITIVRERGDQLPSDGLTLVATVPLTAPRLAESIGSATGKDQLAFFDAIAPIVHFESIDMETAWFQSRWNKGSGKDYINCPMTQEQYCAFHAGLMAGEKTEFREWEDVPYFEGCMPIEVMAERGLETLRFGPMKGVGLDQPSTGRWPYAV